MSTRQLGFTFDQTVEEGQERVGRTLSSLLATGTVGGIDVSLGVLALLLVDHETHNHLLSALAFSVGFIALTLANSELFTENFLVPISALVAGRTRITGVLRLWLGTLVTNLVGGWVTLGLISAGLPQLHSSMLEIGRTYNDFGIGWSSFALALLGGAIITLMTWMENGTRSMPARLVAASAAAFLLAAGTMNHAIVTSLLMFGALHVGAPFGYADWLGTFAWACLGNALGGLGLVTMLRLAQVGRGKVQESRGGEVQEPAASQAAPF